MKKILVLLFSVVLLSSCANDKHFSRKDGSVFVAEPYGWIDSSEKKIEGVTYKVSVENVILSVLFSETIVAPILITGLQLYEPVSYIDTTKDIKKIE